MSADAPFDLLKQAADRDRLAHAYLLVGPSQGAGGDLATRLIQRLVCIAGTSARPCGTCGPCRKAFARTWPDATWLEPESKSRQLRIEAVRELINTLSKSALTGGWKIGVLQDADRLTPQAANALLKTLEEPSAQTLLLLLSEQPQALLPTIISRCQRVNLAAGRKTLPEPLQTQFAEWLERSIILDGPVNAMGLAAELSALLETARRETESTVKAASTEADDQDGRTAVREQLEARAASRYREIRSRLLEALMLWHRDVLILRAGGDSGILAYPEAREPLLRRARSLTLAQAIEAVDIVEHMSRQIERSLSEVTVFSYGLDRLAQA